MDTVPYITVTHISKDAFRKTLTHSHTYTPIPHTRTSTRATDCTAILICLSGVLSHIFIYLLAHLFVYSLFVGLTFFLFVSLVPRGEWENIHLLMRAVINSEQARPSLPLSECLFLCPSAWLSATISQCVSLPLLCFPGYPSRSLLPHLSHFSSNAFFLLHLWDCPYWVDELWKCCLCMKMLRIQLHIRVFRSFS